MLDPFMEHLDGIEFGEPTIPFVSNVTGKWVTEQQATSPEYWATHLRQTVRFADGLSTVFEEGSRLFLEVGPGDALSQMVYQHNDKK
ncbi:MAG: hypothetical protein ACO225_10420, partial [Ilumatobacteraceae bacterium]